MAVHRWIDVNCSTVLHPHLDTSNTTLRANPSRPDESDGRWTLRVATCVLEGRRMPWAGSGQVSEPGVRGLE